MDLILNIETSTAVCSVAVASGDKVIAARESRIDRSHAALLTVFIDEVMREADIRFGNLSAVAVSRGPGSYTGLRIGVSAAKGICYGTGVPLIAIDTLKLMAWKVIRLPGTGLQADEDPSGSGNNPPLLCPMIDARRMEVYTAIFDNKGNRLRDVSAEIIDESGFSDIPAGKKILFFGDGSDKCRDIISRPDAIFIPGIYPSADIMAELSDKAFKEGRFEDTAYFEPFYLKDFLATTPKNKLS